MANGKTPSFISIGAQKCATTWLYHCLNDHPQVFLGSKNVIRYFELPFHDQHDWEWYLSHFSGAGPGQVVGEARVEYIYNEETPQLIAARLPKCKLLLNLRDPVERAVSAYFWNVRKGQMPDRPLNEGLSEILKNCEGGRKQPDLVSRILAMGFYAQQLNRYLQHFPLERFLILLVDDIRAKPLECIRAAYRFLGVDVQHVPKGLHSTPLRSAGLPALTWLERKTRFVRGSGKIWEWLNRSASKAGLEKERPQIDPDLEKGLRRFYAGHNSRLLQILREYCAHPGTISGHVRLRKAAWLAGEEDRN